MEINFYGLPISLLPQKALWVKQEKLLVVADLHLGKAQYFQANGIPISANTHVQDLFNLQSLIELYNPNKVLFLGDLFHAGPLAIADFEHFLDKNKRIQFLLTMGNHDDKSSKIVLPQKIISLTDWKVGEVVFQHHPSNSEASPTVCGHIHPKYKIHALPRSKALPCFYWNQYNLILPSFGSFTGGKLVVKDKQTQGIYVVGKEKVFEM